MVKDKPIDRQTRQSCCLNNCSARVCWYQCDASAGLLKKQFCYCSPSVWLGLWYEDSPVAEEDTECTGQNQTCLYYFLFFSTHQPKMSTKKCSTSYIPLFALLAQTPSIRDRGHCLYARIHTHTHTHTHAPALESIGTAIALRWSFIWCRCFIVIIFNTVGSGWWCTVTTHYDYSGCCLSLSHIAYHLSLTYALISYIFIW